jgi:hypothetical protein
VNVTESVLKSIEDVAHWVETHNFRAYDPGDGDLSFLRYFTFNIHFLRRLLTGAVLRSPLNIRPWIGIRPHTSTKGMGYMGWGYLKMFGMTGAEGHRRRAESCFDWLMENRSSGYEQFCWGNDFAFSTRAGTIPKHMPTIVWSSLIGLAFLEAYEVLGNPKYLDVAASTAEWVKSLPREQTDRGICLSYVPFMQSSIHNSNMLGAALLARIASHTGDREACELAKDAMTYSCARQLTDGAWYYGEAPKYHWIDNFHTGYNLDCLKRYIDGTGDREFEPCLRTGFRYFESHFFEGDGRPKYYQDKAEPIDIQCSAQAIDTLAFFFDFEPGFLSLVLRVALLSILIILARDCYFFYRVVGGDDACIA